MTLRGLVVDWGGVLTGDLRTAVENWAEADGVPLDSYVDTIRDWSQYPNRSDEAAEPATARARTCKAK